jgi:hypothetical protein
MTKPLYQLSFLPLVLVVITVIKARYAVAGILLLTTAAANSFPLPVISPKTVEGCASVNKLPFADAAARSALEAKDYVKVVATYEPFCGNELSAAALYRLAIAYQKLGNPRSAKASLDQALVLNPSGTFASSLQRLETLRNDIGPIPVEAVFTPAPSKDEPNPPPPAVIPVVPTPVAVVEATPVLEKRPVKLEPERATTIQSAPSRWNLWLEGLLGMKPDSARAFLLLSGILAFLLGILTVNFFQKTGFFSPNRKNAGNAARVQLKKLRAAGDELLANLTAAGQQDTDLYVHLVRLLPHVERELGRGEKIQARLSAKDREDLAGFSKVPLKLSSASSEQISELFQARKQ